MDAFLVIGTILMFVVLILMLIKMMNPQFCLIIVGVVAIIAMMFVTGQSVLETSTGNLFFDAFGYLQDSLISSFTSTGITLVVVLGFVEYMNHLKASDMFALSVAKVVVKIKSKYVILILALLLGCVIKWVIPSAVTAFLMLYATIYPVLRHCGIRRITAICAITISMAWSLGPGQPFTGMIYGTFAPDVAMSGPDFFVNYELKYFIPTFVVCAVVFILVTKYFEKREDKNPISYLSEDDAAESDTDTSKLGIPKWYGLLPIIPLVLVILLGGSFLPIKVGVVPVYLFFAILVIIIEMIRKRSIKDATNDFMTFLEGMGLSFGRYATVAWAGVVFADAVAQVGGLDILVNAVVSTDTSVQLFILIISIITIIVSALTSQVMLCIFGLGPIIASFAALTGADITYLLIPMGALATGPNILSVAAPVALVSAEKAGIPVMTYIVRQTIPLVASCLTIVVCTMVMFG